MKNYDELFEVRGTSYDRAMRFCPGARQQEFAQVIHAAQLLPGMVVADVPAGGGYLQRFLPADCVWLGHEPCATFTNHGSTGKQSTALLPLPWEDASIDAAISLAGVHHLEDKRPLFSELYRVVKPGGRMVLSDVATGSAVAHFLDGYVGTHNSTGHQGAYLDSATAAEMQASGWRVLGSEMVDFHWVFASRSALANFCIQLFDLRASDLDATCASIESCLGIAELADGQVGMPWSLMTIVASK